MLVVGGRRRGSNLIRSEGAPEGVVGLQFYPAQDGSEAICLWEAPTLTLVQDYVGATLGDSSWLARWFDFDPGIPG